MKAIAKVYKYLSLLDRSKQTLPRTSTTLEPLIGCFQFEREGSAGAFRSGTPSNPGRDLTALNKSFQSESKSGVMRNNLLKDHSSG